MHILSPKYAIGGHFEMKYCKKDVILHLQIGSLFHALVFPSLPSIHIKSKLTPL